MSAGMTTPCPKCGGVSDRTTRGDTEGRLTGDPLTRLINALAVLAEVTGTAVVTIEPEDASRLCDIATALREANVHGAPLYGSPAFHGYTNALSVRLMGRSA